MAAGDVGKRHNHKSLERDARFPGTGPADVHLIFFSDSKYLEMKVDCFAKWGG